MGDQFGLQTEPDTTPDETTPCDGQIVLQGETVIANKDTDQEKVLLLIDPAVQKYSIQVVDLDNATVDSFDNTPVTPLP